MVQAKGVETNFALIDCFNQNLNLNRIVRRLYFVHTKFRCGAAPIRNETGRHERLPLTKWVRPFCKTHNVITQCDLYDDIRVELYYMTPDEIKNFSIYHL